MYGDPKIEVCGVDMIELNEVRNGVLDLIYLDSRVDQDCHVVRADADDLNGVLLIQRIVDQHELIDEAKDEEGEVAWDGASDAAGLVGVRRERYLELSEDISAVVRQYIFALGVYASRRSVYAPFEAQGDARLDDCHEQEAPTPERVGCVHLS